MRSSLRRPCADVFRLSGIGTSRRWSEQPCVRPITSAHRAAGHNALRGSGHGTDSEALRAPWEEPITASAADASSRARSSVTNQIGRLSSGRPMRCATGRYGVFDCRPRRLSSALDWIPPPHQETHASLFAFAAARRVTNRTLVRGCRRPCGPTPKGRRCLRDRRCERPAPARLS